MLPLMPAAGPGRRGGNQPYILLSDGRCHPPHLHEPAGDGGALSFRLGAGHSMLQVMLHGIAGANLRKADFLGVCCRYPQQETAFQGLETTLSN
jgi:hypothetical protein